MATKNGDYMAMVEDWFGKLPPLPKNAREAIVNITPWVALIFGILGVLAGLAGLGILTAFSPFLFLGGGVAGAAGSLISALIGVVGSILLLAAFPGTKAHKQQGWTFLFWSEALNTLAAVLSISLTGVLIALIGFYLLFQIKSYYKK